MNWLTDMDWGWWPIVSLRPPKDRDIDNRVLFKISPVFGGMAALLCIVLLASRHMISFTVAKVVVIYLLCCVGFFVVYKLTFAYFWNRRATRLRDGQSQQQAVA
ncbi:MAG: hypothetical protein HOO93_00990 [Methyloglobulus sp.]|nr:hypothetical protein [Methyloglobulus sp.]